MNADVFAAALMELGAVVCTSRAPACEICPLLSSCAWVAAGRPAYTGVLPRAQAWHGTDRQARGALLAVLRAAPGTVDADALATGWPETVQRDRALAGLLDDGLVEAAGPGSYRLPV